MATTRSGTCIVPSVNSSGLPDGNALTTTPNGTCIVPSIHSSGLPRGDVKSSTPNGTCIVPSIHSSGLPIHKGPSNFFRIRMLHRRVSQFFSFSLTDQEREHLKMMLLTEYNAGYLRGPSRMKGRNDAKRDAKPESKPLAARIYFKLGKLLNLQET